MSKNPASAAALSRARRGTKMQDYRGVKIRPNVRRARPDGSAAVMRVISKTMSPSDIVAIAPRSANLMAEYGLHCFNCSANTLETLEEGCLGHGFEQEEIDELVDDINQLIAEQPKRPETLMVTKEAAESIREIAAKEGRVGESLAVIADRSGGFCMEFRKDIALEERRFVNSDVPDITVTASSATLQAIGGATIDFREGRFKLDIAEDGCDCGKSCACHAS